MLDSVLSVIRRAEAHPFKEDGAEHDIGLRARERAALDGKEVMAFDVCIDQNRLMQLGQGLKRYERGWIEPMSDLGQLCPRKNSMNTVGKNVRELANVGFEIICSVR